MQAAVQILLTLATICHAEEAFERTCRDLSCASRDSLLKQIHLLQQDVREHSQSLADAADCTACYSNPCLNDGKCISDGKYGYRCDCPEDTKGDHCETRVACTPDTCGAHATCFVKNHQTNCACDFGYSGDPKVGCTFASRKICFNGDPHYNTFDGGYFSYQSTCPYDFSLPCADALADGYSYFSVKAKNDIQTKGQPVSYVTSTQVEFYNQTIYVDRSLNVFLNGIQIHIPYFYPSQAAARFSVLLRNNDIVIQNDQFVEVDFHYGQLCLVVPDLPELRGNRTLCGLAGNFDGNCKNDFVKRDGTVLGSECRPAQSIVDAFADSWRTDDYTHPTPKPACIDGWTMTNESVTCKDVESLASLCVDIDNARVGMGPFGACRDIGVDTIQKAYDSCIYDVCLDKSLRCNSLADFVHSCQFALPGVQIDHWRDKTNCPMSCPVHSSYSECVSACPATCSSHDAPSECDQPGSEGCACDYGYVLDTTHLQTVTCIRVQDCGCTDDDGNMHPADRPWLTDDCTQENWCSNGTYIHEPFACQPDAHCGVTESAIACVCDAGYTLNATTGACDDIDECLDPTSCSAGVGHGACVNTPGSYYCVCLKYYIGHDCERYAPNRHCADLRKYYNIDSDGAYTVEVPMNETYGEIEVYCDMTRGGGGWMLMANAIANETAGKTFDEYAAGFGSANTTDVWLGLDLVSLYTNYQQTRLVVGGTSPLAQPRPADRDETHLARERGSLWSRFLMCFTLVRLL